MLERQELKSIMDSWKLPESSLLLYYRLLFDFFEVSRPLSLFRIIFQYQFILNNKKYDKSSCFLNKLMRFVIENYRIIPFDSIR